MPTDEFRYHPQRRLGRGVVESPVRRSESRCAVENCPELGRLLRVTRREMSVLYCTPHKAMADVYFA